MVGILVILRAAEETALHSMRQMMQDQEALVAVNEEMAVQLSELRMQLDTHREREQLQRLSVPHNVSSAVPLPVGADGQDVYIPPPDLSPSPLCTPLLRSHVRPSPRSAPGRSKY